MVIYAEGILLKYGGWTASSNAAMERLLEYRTAPIAATVTGKIGVRKEIAA